MGTSAIMNGIRGGGKVAQVVYAATSTATSTATIIPLDNTIPQNTEGAELLTVSITPTNANSTLLIEFNGGWGSSNPSIIIALFVDSTANALTATITTPNGVGYSQQFGLKYIESAGSTATRTYKIRYGPSSATAYMLNYNGNNAFSTAKQATLTVTEILP